jgi:hypothetical protein
LYQKSIGGTAIDKVKQQTAPSTAQKNVEEENKLNGQQQVMPVSMPVRQRSRILPHAMRSSFAFGTAYGADDDTTLQDKQKWREDLRRQIEEKKACEAGKELRQRVIDERDMLRDSCYQTWQTRTVPAVSKAVIVAQGPPSAIQLLSPPPAIQTDSPEKLPMSTKSGEERSFHRQHRLLLDPSVLSDMEQRHQKDMEHHKFIKQQLEEKQRLKRKQEEQLAREAALDEARLEREREQLRLQYEKEQECVRQKEETARKRRELLEQQIRQAQEAAIQEKHAKVRRHVGRVSPLEIVSGEICRKDEELPSSRKILTLSASRHVFTDNTDTQPDPIASPIANAVNERDAVSRQSVNDRYASPIERPVDHSLQQSRVIKAKVKQQSTTGDSQKLTSKTGQKTRKKTQQHKDEQIQAQPTDNVKSNMANNRYRQKQSRNGGGNATRQTKKDGLLQRHATGYVSSHPLVRDEAGIQLETKKALPVTGGAFHQATTVEKPVKAPKQTQKRQAGGLRKVKQQEERRVQHGKTLEKDMCERNHSLPPVSLAKQRHEQASYVTTYVVDGCSESDDNESEALSVPSTGDAYQVPVRRTSATLPTIMGRTSSRSVHKQSGQESEKFQNMLARITSAGGSESQLYFHSNRSSEDDQKEEQQTVRPHPLQLPGTTSQVLLETKKYLENRRQQHQQRQWHQSNDITAASSRQEEILSHLALLRQGLVKKQEQLRLH